MIQGRNCSYLYVLPSHYGYYLANQMTQQPTVANAVMIVKP